MSKPYLTARNGAHAVRATAVSTGVQVLTGGFTAFALGVPVDGYRTQYDPGCPATLGSWNSTAGALEAMKRSCLASVSTLPSTVPAWHPTGVAARPAAAVVACAVGVAFRPLSASVAPEPTTASATTVTPRPASIFTAIAFPRICAGTSLFFLGSREAPLSPAGREVI